MLTLPNPKYCKILKKYPHLKEVHMNDTDQKERLLVHINLGTSDFEKIKMEKSRSVGLKIEKSPRIGKISELLPSSQKWDG